MRFSSYKRTEAKWFESKVLAGFTVFALLLLKDKAPGFVYDAWLYWNGAQSIATLHNPYVSGWLAVRGVLSSFIYVPSALASQFIGTEYAWTVLVQNAVGIAFLGAFLVPKILERLGLFGPRVLWLSSLLVAFSFGGFAPYPLMDLWGLVAFVFGLHLAFNTLMKNWFWGAFLLSASVNLRPAYLVPVLLVGIYWFVINFKKYYVFALGFLLALVPQVLLNYSVKGSILPWPVEVNSIANTQSTFATYIYRYDTVAYDSTRGAAQFFCSPGMAKIPSLENVTNSIETVVVFLQNIPYSLVFLAEKFSSLFIWSSSTPYLKNTDMGLTVFSLLLVGIFALGTVGLATEMLRNKSSFFHNQSLAAIIFSAFGIFSTLLMTTPEARYAAPLVLFAIFGVITFVERDWVKPYWLKILALLIFVAMIYLGTKGMSHPAPPGLVPSPSICGNL